MAKRVAFRLRFAPGAWVDISRTEAVLLARMIHANAGVERLKPLSPAIDSLRRKGALKRITTTPAGVEIYMVTAVGRGFSEKYAEQRHRRTMTATRLAAREAAKMAKMAKSGTHFEIPAFGDEIGRRIND